MIRASFLHASIALTAACAAAFYDRYYKWRACFNEQGRCFDPASGTVALEQSGMVWGGLTALGLLATLYQISRMQHKKRRSPSPGPKTPG